MSSGHLCRDAQSLPSKMNSEPKQGWAPRRWHGRAAPGPAAVGAPAQLRAQPALATRAEARAGLPSARCCVSPLRRGLQGLFGRASATSPTGRQGLSRVPAGRRRAQFRGTKELSLAAPESPPGGGKGAVTETEEERRRHHALRGSAFPPSHCACAEPGGAARMPSGGLLPGTERPAAAGP